MSIDDAIAMLRREYEKALTQEWILSPLAWALYIVWKKADSERKEE